MTPNSSAGQDSNSLKASFMSNSSFYWSIIFNMVTISDNKSCAGQQSDRFRVKLKSLKIE